MATYTAGSASGWSGLVSSFLAGRESGRVPEVRLRVSGTGTGTSRIRALEPTREGRRAHGRTDGKVTD